MFTSYLNMITMSIEKKKHIMLHQNVMKQLDSLSLSLSQSRLNSDNLACLNLYLGNKDPGVSLENDFCQNQSLKIFQ